MEYRRLGRSDIELLEINPGAADLELEAEVLEDIDSIYRQHPFPY